jgi:hypothetical protein
MLITRRRWGMGFFSGRDTGIAPDAAGMLAGRSIARQTD